MEDKYIDTSSEVYSFLKHVDFRKYKNIDDYINSVLTQSGNDPSGAYTTLEAQIRELQIRVLKLENQTKDNTDLMRYISFMESKFPWLLNASPIIKSIKDYFANLKRGLLMNVTSLMVTPLANWYNETYGYKIYDSNYLGICISIPVVKSKIIDMNSYIMSLSYEFHNQETDVGGRDSVVVNGISINTDGINLYVTISVGSSFTNVTMIENVDCDVIEYQIYPILLSYFGGTYYFFKLGFNETITYYKLDSNGVLNRNTVSNTLDTNLQFKLDGDPWGITRSYILLTSYTKNTCNATTYLITQGLDLNAVYAAKSTTNIVGWSEAALLNMTSIVTCSLEIETTSIYMIKFMRDQLLFILPMDNFGVEGELVKHVSMISMANSTQLAQLADTTLVYTQYTIDLSQINVKLFRKLFAPISTGMRNLSWVDPQGFSYYGTTDVICYDEYGVDQSSEKFGIRHKISDTNDYHKHDFTTQYSTDAVFETLSLNATYGPNSETRIINVKIGVETVWLYDDTNYVQDAICRKTAHEWRASEQDSSWYIAEVDKKINFIPAGNQYHHDAGFISGIVSGYKGIKQQLRVMLLFPDAPTNPTFVSAVPWASHINNVIAEIYQEQNITIDTWSEFTYTNQTTIMYGFTTPYFDITMPEDMEIHLTSYVGDINGESTSKWKFTWNPQGNSDDYNDYVNGTGDERHSGPQPWSFEPNQSAFTFTPEFQNMYRPMLRTGYSLDCGMTTNGDTAPDTTPVNGTLDVNKGTHCIISTRYIWDGKDTYEFEQVWSGKVVNLGPGNSCAFLSGVLYSTAQSKEVWAYWGALDISATFNYAGSITMMIPEAPGQSVPVVNWNTQIRDIEYIINQLISYVTLLSVETKINSARINLLTAEVNSLFTIDRLTFQQQNKQRMMTRFPMVGTALAVCIDAKNAIVNMTRGNDKIAELQLINVMFGTICSIWEYTKNVNPTPAELIDFGEDDDSIWKTDKNVLDYDPVENIDYKNSTAKTYEDHYYDPSKNDDRIMNNVHISWDDNDPVYVMGKGNGLQLTDNDIRIGTKSDPDLVLRQKIMPHIEPADNKMFAGWASPIWDTKGELSWETSNKNMFAYAVHEAVDFAELDTLPVSVTNKFNFMGYLVQLSDDINTYAYMLMPYIQKFLKISESMILAYNKFLVYMMTGDLSEVMEAVVALMPMKSPLYVLINKSKQALFKINDVVGVLRCVREDVVDFTNSITPQNPVITDIQLFINTSARQLNDELHLLMEGYTQPKWMSDQGITNLYTRITT